MGVKLHDKITINDKEYPAGAEIPWYTIYPFFLVHMLAFGASGFFMAYGADDVPLLFLYMHGGFAIFVYLIFYLAIFGPDRVKWMFIDAALGIFGIIAQLSWLLGWLFDRDIGDYSVARHVVPFGYYILYTFLLHQAVLDFTGSRDDAKRRAGVNFGYVGFSLAFYGVLLL